MRLWQSRVRIPEEIQGEVRGRVAERLVQVHAQPGLGGRHAHVEHDLTREAQHVPGKGGGGRRRHGPCLAEQSERGGAQVRWQASRLRRQHQRIRRQRHAQLSNRVFECEAARDLLVRIERRGGDLAGDAGDQIERHGGRVAGRDELDRLGRLADQRRAREVAREQVEAHEVRGRLGRVGHRDVKTVRFPRGHDFRVDERQRVGRVAHQHRAGGAPANRHRAHRQAVQRAADLHLDDVAAFAAAFDEELRVAGFTGTDRRQIVGRPELTIGAGLGDRLHPGRLALRGVGHRQRIVARAHHGVPARWQHDRRGERAHREVRTGGRGVRHHQQHAEELVECCLMPSSLCATSRIIVGLLLITSQRP